MSQVRVLLTAGVPTVADVVQAVEQAWPAALAADWDAVGLVCGDPDAPVRRVHLAVDPEPEVVAEALAGGADLLLVHHPLHLRGTTSVAATTRKGRVVHELIRGGCALLTAHTNADHADPGVSDALGALFGLQATTPLAPLPGPPLDALVVFVPVADAAAVLDAVADAGAGAIGAYDRAAWTGTGTFSPLPGAQPAVGQVGRSEQVPEARLEVVLPRALRTPVLAAMRAAHPYEEPAFDLLELAALPGPAGTGRVGDLPAPLSLRALADLAATVLPATAWGVRAAGDPDAVVSRLAVCGGSGGDLAAAASRAGAQALLTSDLRHHQVLERPEGLALLDAAHWATEWPWLPRAAALLARLGVDTVVSTLVTDPFCLSSRSPRA